QIDEQRTSRHGTARHIVAATAHSHCRAMISRYPDGERHVFGVITQHYRGRMLVDRGIPHPASAWEAWVARPHHGAAQMPSQGVNRFRGLFDRMHSPRWNDRTPQRRPFLKPRTIAHHQTVTKSSSHG